MDAANTFFGQQMQIDPRIYQPDFNVTVQLVYYVGHHGYTYLPDMFSATCLRLFLKMLEHASRFFTTIQPTETFGALL